MPEITPEKNTTKIAKANFNYWLQKLHNPLLLMAILLIALFCTIFKSCCGLGILAIILALVLFFVSYNDEYSIKIKEYLTEIPKNLERPEMKFYVDRFLKFASILATYNTKLTYEDKNLINEKIIFLQKEINFKGREDTHMKPPNEPNPNRPKASR